jgi:hypothetical protein
MYDFIWKFRLEVPTSATRKTLWPITNYIQILALCTSLPSKTWERTGSGIFTFKVCSTNTFKRVHQWECSSSSIEKDGSLSILVNLRWLISEKFCHRSTCESANPKCICTIKHQINNFTPVF